MDDTKKICISAKRLESFLLEESFQNFKDIIIQRYDYDCSRSQVYDEIDNWLEGIMCLYGEHPVPIRIIEAVQDFKIDFFDV